MAVVYIVCGGCHEGYNPNETSHSCVASKTFKGKNAQLHVKERPVVWQHPKTGEVRYPGHTGEMPGYYQSQGYERKEFTSYQEHKKFCDDNGMINHAVEGIKDEALEG